MVSNIINVIRCLLAHLQKSSCYGIAFSCCLFARNIGERERERERESERESLHKMWYQNPCMAEEQTAQWPNEKARNDEQRSTVIHIKLEIKLGVNSGAPEG